MVFYIAKEGVTIPIHQIRMIFCKRWGKLLKVEEFGDAITLEE